jgi:hypothetical protein
VSFSQLRVQNCACDNTHPAARLVVQARIVASPFVQFFMVEAENLGNQGMTGEIYH